VSQVFSVSEIAEIYSHALGKPAALRSLTFGVGMEVGEAAVVGGRIQRSYAFVVPGKRIIS